MDVSPFALDTTRKRDMARLSQGACQTRGIFASSFHAAAYASGSGASYSELVAVTY